MDGLNDLFGGLVDVENWWECVQACSMELVGVAHHCGAPCVEIFVVHCINNDINVFLRNIFFQTVLHEIRCLKSKFHSISGWHILLKLLISLWLYNANHDLQFVEPELH